MRHSLEHRSPSRVVGRALALALLIVSLFSSREARADDPVALYWPGAAGCPDGAYVQSEIARLLRSTEPSAPDVPVVASAVVSRAGDTWTVDIRTRARGESGHRTFQGDSCRSVADAAALLLALIVNPQKVAAHPAEGAPPIPVPETPKPIEAPPPPPRVEPAPRAEQRALVGSVAVLGTVDLGTVPTPGFGGGIAAGFLLRRVRLEAFGFGEPFRSASLTDVPGVGARFLALRAGVRTCFALLQEPLEIAPCVGEQTVWMKARAFGISAPGENDTMWGEVIAGVRASWTLLGGLGPVLDIGAQIPLRRREFVIVPYGVVHEVPGVNMRATAGLELRF